jgi:hypothetical protein
MPIQRFANQLRRMGLLEDYMNLLVNSFNLASTAGLMCKNTLSVSWSGALFDCDFNQQLNLGIVDSNATGKAKKPPQLDVFSINSCDDLLGKGIEFDKHCFGCTAGSGSSCQGATV